MITCTLVDWSLVSSSSVLTIRLTAWLMLPVVILFWIFPNLDGQRNPKWPAMPKHLLTLNLRAFVRTLRE